jgi:hypothetical protein
LYSVIWSKHLILLVHHMLAKHMSFSKWNKRMVPYSITVYFVTLVFIHLNFHCWEACNLNNLAIFFFFNQYNFNFYSNHYRGCRGRDRMVVGFKLPVQSVPITTNVRSNSTQARCTDDTTLCDKVCQWLATSQWFSPGTPVSFTNKTDRQDVTEILLKVALSTIKPNQTNLIIILIY